VNADHCDLTGRGGRVETDRGLWVMALCAAGYAVYAINPRQVARYRERHGTSGAKSDKADSHTMAGMVRVDSPPAGGREERAGQARPAARAARKPRRRRGFGGPGNR
jgi:transposase